MPAHCAAKNFVLTIGNPPPRSVSRNSCLIACRPANLRPTLSMKTSLFPILVLFTTVTVFAADPAPDAGPAPTEAETKAVAELAKLGIDVSPIAANINWRSASIRPAGTKPDAKVFPLLKDVANLQELSLPGVPIEDADLANIAGLANLRVLS